MTTSNQVSSYGTLFTALTTMVSPAHQAITRRPLYDQLVPLDFRPRRGLVQRFRHVVEGWRQRAAERQALQNLDDRLLRDIGLERADVFAEIRKPFWRD